MGNQRRFLWRQGELTYGQAVLRNRRWGRENAGGSPAWAGCPGSNGDFARIDDGGALLASFLASPAYGDLTALLDPADPAIQVRGDLAEVLVSRDGDRGLLVPIYVGESAVGNIGYDPGGRAIAQVRTAKGVRIC